MNSILRVLITLYSNYLLSPPTLQVGSRDEVRGLGLAVLGLGLRVLGTHA